MPGDGRIAGRATISGVTRTRLVIAPPGPAWPGGFEAAAPDADAAPHVMRSS
jgi:hypothetical protein